MKTAFLFPGQGVRAERELEGWFRGSREVARLVELAARLSGIPVDGLFTAVRRGTAGTEHLEPAHTALCLGIHRELASRGVIPDIVAGHSLGEIAACAAAGCCSPEEAVGLAADRGRLMAREAARHPGGMVQIAAESRAAAEEAAAWAREAGMAGLATHNVPGRWGIAGEWPALRRLAARYEATPVPVAGAWHCEVMEGAVSELREASRRTLTMPMRIPLVTTLTGTIAGATAGLPDVLAEQLTRPVEWVRTMETLAAFGTTDVVTVGPGRALRVLAHSNAMDRWTLHSTDSPEALLEGTRALAR